MDIQKVIDDIVAVVNEAVEAFIELVKDICNAVAEALRLWLVHEPKRKTTIGASMSRFKSWIRKIFQRRRRIRRKYTRCMKGVICMNKSKEEILEEAKKYMPKPLVSINGLGLMLLESHIMSQRRKDAIRRWIQCEMAYKEYQKRVRLINQVTKEES